MLGVRAVLAFPLIAGGEVFGVGVAYISKERDALNADDVRLAEEIGSILGLAFANERLFDETRQHLAESQSLQRVQSELLQKIALKEILEVVVHGGPAVDRGHRLRSAVPGSRRAAARRLRHRSPGDRVHTASGYWFLRRPGSALATSRC